MPVTWNDHELTNPPEATDAAIQAAEAALGVRFPADYVEVMRVHQGRTPSPSDFPLGDGTSSVFNHLLHVEPSSSWANIVQVQRMLDHILPARLIPFAADPGGNFLCFDYRSTDEQPPVVFWVHDDPDAPITRVASSFSELLTLLYA